MSWCVVQCPPRKAGGAYINLAIGEVHGVGKARPSSVPGRRYAYCVALSAL
jgi:hypothetical protein